MARGPFYKHELTLTPVWISTSNHLLSNMWDKITYPFPNFNGCTVEIWEWISNIIPQFMMDVIMHAGIKVNPYYQKEP